MSGDHTFAAVEVLVNPRSKTVIIVLDTQHISPINVGISLVDGVHVELLEDPPGEEKTGVAVSSGVPTRKGY